MTSVLAFDTETRLFRAGYMAPRIICVGWAAGVESGVVVDQKAIQENLAIWLELAAAGEKTLVNHNMAYDMACVLSSYPSLSELVWKVHDRLMVKCTLIREQLLRIAQGGSSNRKGLTLKALAASYTGRTLEKTWQTGFTGLEGVPKNQWPKEALAYVVADAETALGIYERQREKAREMSYDAFEEESARQSSYALALQLASARGVMIDQTRVAKLKSEKMSTAEGLKAELVAAGFFHGKGGQKNTKVVQSRVVSTYPGDPQKTKTGRISISGDVLEKCDDPDLQKMVEYDATIKELSTFIVKLEAAGDDPLHPSYDVLGARSGRTSSFKPNFQNPPRAPGIRECFVARPGHFFIFCDFDSQEIRTLGEVCCHVTGAGVSSIAKRYKIDPDYDPHSDFAGQILGLSYDEALKRKAAKDPAFLAARQKAKAANFGFPGGMGVASFQTYARGYGLELTFQEAQQLRDSWFRKWPEMRPYFQYIETCINSHHGLVTIPVSGRVRGGCSYTSGANALFQGLAADASKRALYNVARKCFDVPGSSALAGCRPIFFIHDEIGFNGAAVS